MTEGHRQHFRAIEPHEAFTILLVAPSRSHRDHATRDRSDHPQPGVASPAGRLEAAISVARAAFAAGGRIVMPGDRGMSPVVAAVALDYTALPASERSREPPASLVVVDTEQSDTTLAALLAPYGARGAVIHVGPHDDPVRIEPGWEADGIDPSPGQHQSVTSELIERWDPAGAVFVSPELEARAEMELLEERGIPVAAIAHLDPERAERLRDRDEVRRIMSDRRRRWLDHDDIARGRGREGEVEPYAYLAQRLVGEWAR